MRQGYRPAADPAELERDLTRPTACPAGSPGKLRVLEARAAAGLPLFVAGDAAKLAGAPPAQARACGQPRGLGVERAKRKWKARVSVPALCRGQPGRQIYLGLFATIEEAIAAVAVARARMAAGLPPRPEKATH